MISHGMKAVVQRNNVAQKSIVNLACQRCLSTTKGIYEKKYSKEHEWIEVVDGVGSVGISDHAQNAVGDLTYVELPEVDEEYEKDASCGEVESSKATSEVFTPVGGVVIEVNEKLIETPEIINKSPEDEGWMFKIKLSDPSELDDLMDKAGYDQYLKEHEDE